GNLVLVLKQEFFELIHVAELALTVQLVGAIHHGSVFGLLESLSHADLIITGVNAIAFAPTADDVETLQGKTRRVDFGVAGGAGRILPVLGKLCPDGGCSAYVR